MRLRHTLLGAAAMAALVVPLAASPAAASEYSGSCGVLRLVGLSLKQTSWAHVDADWSTKYKMSSVALLARDTEADGHHAAVRLVTWQADGDVHYWSWHHYYGGDGGQDYWVTSASDTAGIKYAAVQGATMEGDDVLTSCFSTKTANPIW